MGGGWKEWWRERGGGGRVVHSCHSALGRVIHGTSAPSDPFPEFPLSRARRSVHPIVHVQWMGWTPASHAASSSAFPAWPRSGPPSNLPLRWTLPILPAWGGSRPHG